MIYRNYWLVIGRMPFDYEDTSFSFEHCTQEQARANYIDAMWALEVPDETARAQERALAKSINEGVRILRVFASDSPIEEIS